MGRVTKHSSHIMHIFVCVGGCMHTTFLFTYSINGFLFKKKRTNVEKNPHWNTKKSKNSTTIRIERNLHEKVFLIGPIHVRNERNKTISCEFVSIFDAQVFAIFFRQGQHEIRETRNCDFNKQTILADKF
jgi:hypothetical protein